MLASHNTLTHLRARRWWARIIRPLWQCQSRPPTPSAARLDIRVRRDHRGRWWPCHGIIDLGPTSYLTLSSLLRAAVPPDIPLRIVLERGGRDPDTRAAFRAALLRAVSEGRPIAEAAVKSPWTWLIGPDTTLPAQDHYFKPLDTGRPWYKQFASIIRALTTTPRRYARRHPIPPDHLTDTTLHYHDFIP